MYTRDQGPRDGPDIRPPDNYSGTAFRSGIRHPPETINLPPGLLSDEGGKYERDTVARQPRSYIKKVSPDSGPPSKPEGDRKHSFPGAAPPKEPEQGRDAETGHKASHSEGEPHKEDLEAEACARPHSKNPLKGLFSSIMPPGFSRRGEGEFGFEELLIIGLILLLSQSDADNDILLLLALLLFC
jgi:hypothetical protein